MSENCCLRCQNWEINFLDDFSLAIYIDEYFIASRCIKMAEILSAISEEKQIEFPEVVITHEHDVCSFYEESKDYCLDCKKDLDINHSNDEYYMVKNKIWNEFVNYEESSSMLCLGCLSKRMGRELTKKDFNFKLPINQMNPFVCKLFGKVADFN